jgi:phosphoribosylamine---glycine ligase
MITNPINILVIGTGGREHAICWKIKQSKHCKNLHCIKGNAGIAELAICVSVNTSDFKAIENYVLTNEISLVVVGPEQPLVDGIVDYFRKTESLKNVKIIGPSQQGAMLEGSKDFSKAFMLKHGVPTAKAATFTKNQLHEGLEYLKTHPLPIVLKADGLAAGKGVIIAFDTETALKSLEEMLNGQFGEASAKVLVEQFLDGIEMSAFVLTDGKNYLLLPEAKDYKRIGEKDTGPNTGGMGAVSPVPFADDVFLKKLDEKVIQPTINGLKSENIDYLGFVFIGIMKVGDEPYVIEYNVRMGDPETEVVFPRISSDVVEMFWAVGEQKLNEYQLKVDERTATTVMLVSGGYPGKYATGKEINGISEQADTIVFHAGTKKDDGKLLTNGGRVLSITAFGNSIEDALGKSNKMANQISWEGKYFRRDIGLDLMR